MSANERQHGGDHYQSSVQHWDVITDNYGPSYLIACATKYVTRWRKKNGVQDLAKADHYLEKLQEWTKANGVMQWEAPVVFNNLVADYCDVNKLDEVESRIITTLFGPWTRKELQFVRLAIQSMIEYETKGDPRA